MCSLMFITPEGSSQGFAQGNILSIRSRHNDCNQVDIEHLIVYSLRCKLPPRPLRICANIRLILEMECSILVAPPHTQINDNNNNVSSPAEINTFPLESPFIILKNRAYIQNINLI